MKRSRTAPKTEYFETIHDPEIMRRFQKTIELFKVSLEIQRGNFLRRQPGLTAEEVDQKLQAWLRDRPVDIDSPKFRPSRRFEHLFTE